MALNPAPWAWALQPAPRCRAYQRQVRVEGVPMEDRQTQAEAART